MSVNTDPRPEKETYTQMLNEKFAPVFKWITPEARMDAGGTETIDNGTPSYSCDVCLSWSAKPLKEQGDGKRFGWACSKCEAQWRVANSLETWPQFVERKREYESRSEEQAKGIIEAHRYYRLPDDFAHLDHPSFLRDEAAIRENEAKDRLIVETRKRLAQRSAWPSCECGLNKRVEKVHVQSAPGAVVASFVCANSRCIPALDLRGVFMDERYTRPFQPGAIIEVKP